LISLFHWIKQWHKHSNMYARIRDRLAATLTFYSNLRNNVLFGIGLREARHSVSLKKELHRSSLQRMEFKCWTPRAAIGKRAGCENDWLRRLRQWEPRSCQQTFLLRQSLDGLKTLGGFFIGLIQSSLCFENGGNLKALR